MVYLSRFKFSKMKSGEVAHLFRFDNQNMTVDITDFGAAIVAINVPDKNGKMADVVLGFSNVQGYEEQNCYLGVVAGRYANRIAKGKFTLNNQQYTLETNDGENHLHGGFNGFSKRLWTAEIIGTKEQPKLKLSLLSEDMEGGYPAAVTAEVIYALTEDNQLVIEYRAASDKDTIINLTNHSYFNLNGHNKGDILRQRLYINADKFVRIDNKAIPTGELPSVEGTPFDFRSMEDMHTVGERIANEDADLACGGGYDHCYVLNSDGTAISHAATLKEDYTGRQLDVYTNKPGIQLYTGNMLDGSILGKGNSRYGKRSGLCLETQFLPDSPNQRWFSDCVLKAGEEYRYTTIFKFSVQNAGKPE